MTALADLDCEPILNNHFSNNNLSSNNVNIQMKSSSNNIDKNNSNQANLDVSHVNNLAKFILCHRALINRGALQSIIKKNNLPADILKNNKKERATN